MKWWEVKDFFKRKICNHKFKMYFSNSNNQGMSISREDETFVSVQCIISECEFCDQRNHTYVTIPLQNTNKPNVGDEKSDL